VYGARCTFSSRRATTILRTAWMTQPRIADLWTPPHARLTSPASPHAGWQTMAERHAPHDCPDDTPARMPPEALHACVALALLGVRGAVTLCLVWLWR
jgi:hypothetical protein